MSKASNRAHARTDARIERSKHRIALFASVLLHALLLLVALLSPPIDLREPQGDAAGGSRVEVDFIGDAPPQPIPSPAPRVVQPTRPAAAPPAASRLQTTPAPQADQPLPPDAFIVVDTPPAPQVPQPSPQPDSAAPAPEATPPPSGQRRAHVRGQPPGMLPQDLAPDNAGLARSSNLERGRRPDASGSGPNLGVGGYHVYYDLSGERRLSEWRDQGMTEIFIPLPGTRQRMVCPLEIALRRGSGECRLLDPDDPEMVSIGDAREVLRMQQVSRLGQVLWRGPGPYR